MWIPDSAKRQMERSRFNDDVAARIVADTLATMNEFNYELQQIDPLLEIVRAGDRIDPGTPLKPGYWHVIRRNEGAPWSVMVVEGENGEYVEPTSRLFEKLRQGDLWSPENMKRIETARQKATEAAERMKTRERQERQQELMERWKATSQTQVSMNVGEGWAQNINGVKRTRGIKRAA